VPVAEAFDGWLRETMAMDPDPRESRLIAWERAPAARAAHPREEHLIPLMVAVGAAGDDRATLGYQGTFGGLRLSSYHFGVT
jgi:aromatic ring-opening dioxygenase catalytic subunit (LigB family)